MNSEILAGVAAALFVLALLALFVFGKKPAAVFHSDGEIRAEVERYRASIKARTLCERCLSPNPSKSNYCAECGSSL